MQSADLQAPGTPGIEVGGPGQDPIPIGLVPEQLAPFPLDPSGPLGILTNSPPVDRVRAIAELRSMNDLVISCSAASPSLGRSIRSAQQGELRHMPPHCTNRRLFDHRSPFPPAEETCDVAVTSR